MEPSSEFDDFSAFVTVPAHAMRSSKCKSEVTSDISDVDLARPAKKKPGPKPKAKATKPSSDSEDSELESDPKPAKKKPSPQPKSKSKATAISKGKKAKKVDPDVEDVEIIKPALMPQKIVLIVSEVATEGSRRVSLKASVSFEDVYDLLGAKNKKKALGTTTGKRKLTFMDLDNNDKEG
ncbi:hypothetical protein B0H14DRAFT_3446520 [Mycena olivaceomarginata]|nr:hypothetical protein B0H14DRAFT_3446520 [Mycena olivaceomarginata]